MGDMGFETYIEVIYCRPLPFEYGVKNEFLIEINVSGSRNFYAVVDIEFRFQLI